MEKAGLARLFCVRCLAQGDERSALPGKSGRQIRLGWGADYHLGDDPEQPVLVSIGVPFEQSRPTKMQ
jgi:hypothetical protein